MRYREEGDREGEREGGEMRDRERGEIDRGGDI